MSHTFGIPNIVNDSGQSIGFGCTSTIDSTEPAIRSKMAGEIPSLRSKCWIRNDTNEAEYWLSCLLSTGYAPDIFLSYSELCHRSFPWSMMNHCLSIRAMSKKIHVQWLSLINRQVCWLAGNTCMSKHLKANYWTNSIRKTYFFQQDSIMRYWLVDVGGTKWLGWYTV